MSENNAEKNEAQSVESESKGPSMSEVETLKSQLEKFKNDYLYLRAEFDTYRRNVIKERADLLKYGGEKLVVDLLGVLDNFERALETKPNPENLLTYVKGIEMTQMELRSVLQKHNVSEVPSQGAAFDPNLHEALSSEESQEIKPGFITRVFKKPYKYHDKVIRTGQVVVAKEPAN